MVDSIADSMSEAALEAATGHDSAHWFALLDGAGATGWAHPDIAQWLKNEQGVADWWCQSITVRYEQARGIRAPGQRADGTFQVNASRTVDGELVDVYAKAVAAFSASFGDPSSSRSTGARPYARWTLGEPGSVIATAEVARGGRIRIASTHERMPGPDADGSVKAALVAALDAVASGGNEAPSPLG